MSLGWLRAAQGGLGWFRAARGFGRAESGLVRISSWLRVVETRSGAFGCLKALRLQAFGFRVYGLRFRVSMGLL